MKKKKYNNKLPIFYIIVGIIIIILLVINIIFIYIKYTEEQYIIEEVYYTAIEGEYDSSKKYYANLNYTNFKKLYKGKDISVIAIIDSSSRTQNKFIELINKISFYNNIKINLLEISKLSQKNEIAFYNLDSRISKLNSNYILIVSNSKILSITTFEDEEINNIIEGIGE